MSHEAIPVEAEPHAVTVGDKQAVVGVSDFKGRRFLEFRYLYAKPDGKFEGWERGNNGVNIPLEDTAAVLEVMLNALSAYYGASMSVTSTPKEVV